MNEMHKFIIGVRPSSRMFRVSAVGGLAVDSVLALRGKPGTPEDFYTRVTTTPDSIRYELRDDADTNVLKIDRDNIIYIKDAFECGEPIDTDLCLKEFWKIWSELNRVLEVKNIRRIGVAAEYLIDDPHPDNLAIEKLTKFSSPAHPAKFRFRFEDRRPTKEAIAPDIEKDDFLNVIIDIYNSELDADHAQPDSLNFNIDVQRYFYPHLSRLQNSDLIACLKLFKSEAQKFQERLDNLELVGRG